MKIFSIICCVSILFSFSAFCSDHVKEGKSVFLYKAKGRRDPFVPLIGNAPLPVHPGEKEDIRFQGIARDNKGNRVAIINNEIYAVGEGEPGEFSVVEITDMKVVLDKDGKRVEKKLYDFEM